MTFEIIQQKIDAFIEKISSREDIFFKEEKLQLSDALFCAQDKRRNKKFYGAIWKAISDIQTASGTQVPAEIKVIDAGAGIGVLWIFALMQGADEVIFIEENPLSIKVLEEFLEETGFKQNSQIFCADATQLSDLPVVDMIISETIAIDGSEDYHDIIHNLKKFLQPQGVIIPERLEIHETTHSNPLLTGEGTDNILSWRCYLYKDIFIDSGECVSFMNERKV